MSYNNYNQQGYGQQGGYSQINPYGQPGNPYTQQQSNPYQQQQQPQGGYGGYSDQGGYGASNNAARPDLAHQSSSRYDEESQAGGYEMTSINSNNRGDPNRLLNEIRNADRAIGDIENDMQRLGEMQKASLRSTDISPKNQARQDVAALDEDVYYKIRGLLERTKKLKQDPFAANPRNKPQLGKLERRIQQLNVRYRQMDSEFRREGNAQTARQIRYVKPDATEAEIQEAVENGQGQIFSQALLSSDRRGDAQKVLDMTRQRHQDVQKIEQQMVELAKLFNELEAIVVQQEPAVVNIEDQGNKIETNMASANVELDGAVKKARSARKKKWICLGIVLLIIIIIVVVVVVVVEVTKN